MRVQITMHNRTAIERATGRTLSIVAIAAAGSALCADGLVVSTADAQVLDQSASYTYHYFADSDNIHVHSHYTDYLLELENGADVQVEWNREVVIVPGVQAVPGSDEATDAITSASRPISDVNDAFEDYTKLRDQVRADLEYRFASAGYYVSNETDYFAQQVSGGLNYGLWGDNTNIAVGSSYGWDDIQPLADQDTENFADSKSNTYWNAVLTQVLTRSTVVRIGGEMNIARGILHNPYRNVYAGGGPEAELHPERRERRDLFFKLNQYFTNRSSLNISYKYYTDDWGIDSHTLGGRLNQYLTDDVLIRYRYRFYDQTASFFFMDEYPTAEGIDGYRTGDYRMGEFASHLFGTTLDWSLGHALFQWGRVRRPKLIFKYERYFNSNNFSANIFESGVAVNF